MWRVGGQTERADLFVAAYDEGGAAAAARAIADSEAASATAGGALDIATWYARAGDSDATLTWIERAYETRIPTLPVRLRRAEFDLVREDPRYARLLQQLGLPL